MADILSRPHPVPVRKPTVEVTYEDGLMVAHCTSLVSFDGSLSWHLVGETQAWQFTTSAYTGQPAMSAVDLEGVNVKRYTCKKELNHCTYRFGVFFIIVCLQPSTRHTSATGRRVQPLLIPNLPNPSERITNFCVQESRSSFASSAVLWSIDNNISQTGSWRDFNFDVCINHWGLLNKRMKCAKSVLV